MNSRMLIINTQDLHDENTIERAKKLIYESRFIPHFNSTDWGNEILIMHEDGLAFARIYWFNDDNSTVYLDSLSVDKKIRKKGVGTKLQEIRENIGIILGANTSCLWVKEKSWMHKWYQRRGYSDWKIHENEDNCIWMKKTLIQKIPSTHKSNN